MEEQGTLLKKLIRNSKKRKCPNILTNLDNNIWGEGYRIVTKSITKENESYGILVKRRKQILRDLFPQTKKLPISTRDDTDRPEHFTTAELEEAVKCMKTEEAPGPDGLTVEALKIACKIIPEKILAWLNELFERKHIREVWEIARVILIPKEGEDPKESSSYRPICLINTMGKLYERLRQPVGRRTKGKKSDIT